MTVDPTPPEHETLPATPLGAALPDGRTVDDLRAEPVDDPHAVTRTPYPWGVAWTCACGRWEGIATGPSSARWAGADHARHVRDEEAARGQ